MFSYDFKVRKGTKAIYGPSRLLKIISLFFFVLLVFGLFSVIVDGSFSASSLIPTFIIAILALTLLYRDSWVFDNDARNISYVWGFGPFVKKIAYSYDNIERIEVTHFIKGIAEGAAKQEPSWRHRAQVVLSIRINEDLKYDLEIIDEKKSGGKLERNASWLSGFTGISLFVDRPRNTKMYGGVEEIFFRKRGK